VGEQDEIRVVAERVIPTGVVNSLPLVRPVNVMSASESLMTP
jgi:hypothetical protein